MAFNLSVTVMSAKAVCSQGVTPFFLHLAPLAGEVGAKRRVRGTVRETGPVERAPHPTLSPRRAGRGREKRSHQAGTREGSSTIEKRTPALWRFSSETSRQHSSASLRVLNGPLTWAEPSTSLWKFIEPNSPPITQKLLPFVMIASLPIQPPEP